MKRLLSYFLLTLLVTTTLYALRGPVDGRYYNRDNETDRQIHVNNDGYMIGADSDHSVGLMSLNSDAKTTVVISGDAGNQKINYSA